ncbi:MAG: phosphodiester glycosidase family protein [Firmicutes bacterium]|nr:phosphodiester glycosidase family protein [Bacillota bacterium]
MKKWILTGLLVIAIGVTNVIHVKATFRVNDQTKMTEYVEGVRHTEIFGTIEYDGIETSQKINYMGVNPTAFSELNIVVGDNYANHYWDKGTLTTIIDNIHNRYPNYDVIGGVNGDFFGAYGIPIEAYVRNFEVISAGLGNGRNIIGFKDNGEVVLGKPCYDGYELIVYNSIGEKKQSLTVSRINSAPLVAGEISVYFDNYTGSIGSNDTKVTLLGSETHYDDYGKTYFGRGTLLSQTNEPIAQMQPFTFVIVGNNFNNNELITDGDYAVVQKKLACGFEDVRFALGGWAILVKDGVAFTTFTEGAAPTYRHPRTAIGVKEDGTVFFVTVDGRDNAGLYKGMTHPELAQLMVYFGAVNAFNVDGGGSSAMVLKNTEGGYDYLNTPSDGTPRPTTNGVFIVKGEHIPVPEDALFPDTRTKLDNISSININESGYIDFSDVLHATGYRVSIDGVEYDTEESYYQMDQIPGMHEIQIKALGNKTLFKDTDYTEIILYTVYSENMKKIIDFLLDYTEQEATK